MNKKLLVSFALASLTGISTQAKEKNVFRNNPTTSQYHLIYGGRHVGKIHPYLSGHRKHIIMKPTKLPIWNVWPRKDDVHTSIRLQYQFRYPLQSDNGC